MKLIFKTYTWACPQQIEVFNEDGEQLAYIRVRHGWLRVDAGSHGGITIYSADIDGDGFMDGGDKETHMPAIINAICRYWHLNNEDIEIVEED